MISRYGYLSIFSQTIPISLPPPPPPPPMRCVWYWVRENKIGYELLFPHIHSLWWSREKQANAPVFIIHSPLPKSFSACFFPFFSLDYSCHYAGVRLVDSPWRTLWNGLEKIKKLFLYLENLWFSMFGVTVELPGNSSMADIPQIQQFLSGEQLLPVFHCATDRICEPVFKHARVFITCTCWAFSAIQRERKTRQGAKCLGIHWAHSRRLNNSALSEKRGGKGARWCHDSHCQTSGTQLSLTGTCLRDLMGVCMWMFLCLRMRIRPTEANKVSLCTESGGTLVLLDCSAPTVWPQGSRVWILWWPCVLNGK